jgi:hypothetical protein
MNRAWLGIDPGLGGAMALIPSDGAPIVVDYPGDATLSSDALRSWLIDYDIELVAVEAVHSMPGQGVRSMFTFGRSFGEWLGILAALGISHTLVAPQEWQRGVIHASDGTDPKARSLAAARRLFPTCELGRKRDHNRADALLLARWASMQTAR